MSLQQPNDDSSQYITFATLGKPVGAIQINSDNLSNSSDPHLTIPRSYKIILNVPDSSYKVNRACKEKITTELKVYNLQGLPVYYYKIKIQHYHDLYGPFLSIGGKRTVLIDKTPVKTFNVQPRKIVGPKRFPIPLPADRLASDGSVFIGSNHSGLSYYSVPDIKIIPGERYLVSFKYLLPFGDECRLSIDRYYDTFLNWNSLPPIDINLKGNKKNYYKKFKRVINEKECNLIVLRFKLRTDDDFISECFLKDIEVTRIGSENLP